ncbi:GntR family transcriptional regulator [Streptomyces fagopyri]|uniref:GntR family transcriptional regulator n=1 Tax=Streptomyces fagopyri TaxID=2662397 RepID=UPI00380D0C0D
MSADLDRSRPVWRQVAEAISRPIADGTYPSGSQVPGIVELSAECGIEASTAQKALAHLCDTGEVRTELGLDTFAADSK